MWFVGFLAVFLLDVPAWACAVCGGFSSRDADKIYFVSTLMLSAVPLAFMAGMFYYLRRRHQRLSAPVKVNQT